MNNKKAITLVEIIVSAILLASVLAGIVSTFVSTRRMVGKGTERVAAASSVRQALDGLYSAVRADHMDISNNKYDGGTALEEINHPLGNPGVGTVSNLEYDVQAAPAGYDYKNVTATATYTVPG